jgi:hypothetical protein
MDGSFNPSAREGIRDVRWFTPEEACEAVTHTSLRPMMQRARRLVEDPLSPTPGGLRPSSRG